MNPPAQLAAVVRPPWPDEQARLQILLGATHSGAGISRTWLWVLATAAPERLVGAAALHERSSESTAPTAILQLSIQPAWRETAAAQELVATAMAAASQLRLAQVEIDADPSSPLARQLAERGFTAGPVQELWQVIPALVMGDHGDTMLRGLQRRSPVEIARLTADDLLSVRALCSHFGLLAPERVRLLPDPDGFDPELSFGFKAEQQLRAAILCRARGRTAYLEVFARFEDVSTSAPGAMVGLVFTLLKACAERSIQELFCVVRPQLAPDLINLLKRGHGRCVERHMLLSWQPGKVASRS